MSTDGTVARLHRTTTHPNNKLHEYHYFEFLLLNYTHFKHVVFHNNLFRARTYFQFWVENWRTDAKEKKKCCYYIKQNKLPRWKRRQTRDKWFFPFRFNSILQNRQANGTPECVTEISPTEINANGWWCLCESVMRIGDAINKWNWWKTKKIMENTNTMQRTPCIIVEHSRKIDPASSPNEAQRRRTTKNLIKNIFISVQISSSLAVQQFPFSLGIFVFCFDEINLKFTSASGVRYEDESELANIIWNNKNSLAKNRMCSGFEKWKKKPFALIRIVHSNENENYWIFYGCE